MTLGTPQGMLRGMRRRTLRGIPRVMPRGELLRGDNINGFSYKAFAV